MEYLALYLIIVFFALIELSEKYKKNYNKKIFSIVLLIVYLLIFFTGFRERAGADDPEYIRTFYMIQDIFTEDILNSYINYYMEPGFVLLTSLLRTFTDNYHYMFLLIGFLAVSINIYFYYKYSPFVMLSIALYFSHTFLARDMNQIRAGLAAAILLISIKYLKERNFFKFILVVIIASTFHLAAIVFIISYFFTNKTYKPYTYLIILFSSIFLSFLELSKHLVMNLPDFLGIIKSVLLNYYNSIENKDATSTFDITNIKQMAISIVLIICLNRLKNKSEYFTIMFNIYFIGVIWRIIFSDFGIFAARFATFFTIMEVILVPFILLCFTSKERVVIAFLILFYGFATLYLNIFQKEIKPVYEYDNYFIKELM